MYNDNLLLLFLVLAYCAARGILRCISSRCELQAWGKRILLLITLTPILRYLRLSLLWRLIWAFLVVRYVRQRRLLVAKAIQYVGCLGLLHRSSSVAHVLISHRIRIGYLKLSSLALVALHSWSLHWLALLHAIAAYEGNYWYGDTWKQLILLLRIGGLHDKIGRSWVCNSGARSVPENAIVDCIRPCCETATACISVTLNCSRELNPKILTVKHALRH